MPEMLVQGGDVRKGRRKGTNARTALPQKRIVGRAGHPARMRELFLEALRQHRGLTTRAAAQVGIAHTTPHRWAQTCAKFAEKFENEKKLGEKTRLEELEETTHGRATREKNPSDLLAIFLMKKLDNTYRDHVVIGQGAGSVNLQINLCTGAWPQPQPHEKSATEPSNPVTGLGPGQGES